MRNFRATNNLVAVSANSKETAINTEQTLDTSMLCALSNIANLDPRRSTNEEELNGKEEPDVVYDLGNLASMSLDFPKAQPQHFAFVAGFALGGVATAAAGTGYAHTITPISGDEDSDRSVPTFTLAQRLGETILKRRFASMAVDSFNASFSRDDFLKLSASLKGTGKVSDNIEEEDVSAQEDATSLTLASNGVEGADAQGRLDNVQRVRVYNLEGDGAHTEVSYSAVSSATPAVITISAPGSATDSRTYKVLYIPAESGWMTFPARVTETPLRVSQCTFTLGGKWTGSAFDGGRELAAEVKSVEWSYSNNLNVEFNFGANDAYASRIFRPARTQTLKLDREMRDYILQQYIDDNDYDIGVHLIAEGAVFDSPHKYQVEIVWPKCAVLRAPVRVDGKVVAESGELAVLEDDTYGSVKVIVKNLQSSYAA